MVRLLVFLGCVVMVASVAAGATTRPADELVALDIKLPVPAFIGTMKNPPPGAEQVPKTPRAKFFAPAGTMNLSLNRPVSSSDKEPTIGSLGLITDGDKEHGAGSYVELGPETQWVQIDLGRSCAIHAILVWHFHGDARVYHDVVVQVSDDPDFISNVKTVFNNDRDNSSGLGLGKDREWVEYYGGKLIEGKGVRGRYVRLYSKGSTDSDMNHYTEVEVWGK